MRALFRAFAEQVVEVGVVGLAEAIDPRFGKAVEFFTGVWRKYRVQVATAVAQRAEVEQVAGMSPEDVVRDVEPDLVSLLPLNVSLRQEVQLYLSLAPGAVRQSLKRMDDPTGRSAPANFVVAAPQDIAKLFPTSAPQLRPGYPLPGLDSWRLVRPLGAGGFGEVWLAEHDFDMDRRTAVKFCTDPVARQAIVAHEKVQITRAMKQCRHPNIVPLLECNLGGDRPWLMYEYVGGGTLADLIIEWQAQPLGERLDRAVAALRELTAAAAHLHGLSPPLVHRDLKPANVLRCAVTGQLRVTDLGLGGSAVEFARAQGPDGYTSLTGRLPSLLHGAYTMLYASPEQQRGQLPDPRDDIHALGVMGYQMLTGRLDAAPGTGSLRTLKKLGVPDHLIALLTDCASEERDDRPKDGAALLARLTRPRSSAAVVGQQRRPTTVSSPETHEAERRGRTPTPQPPTEVHREIKLTVAERPRFASVSGSLSKPHPLRSLAMIGVALLIPVGCAGLLSGMASWQSVADGPPSSSTSVEQRIPHAEQPAPPPDPKPGDTYVMRFGNPAARMAFSWIPPGRFQMGGDGQLDNPQRWVTITKGFWMGQAEVTEAQWAAAGVIPDHGHEVAIYTALDYLRASNGGAVTLVDAEAKHLKSFTQRFLYPVERVSWEQCNEFCESMRRSTGRLTRLPTEAEWEYACRAGTTTEYWGGNGKDSLQKVGWYAGNSIGHSHVVGDKNTPNPWGLHDMHGNLWEWCADGYTDLDASDPTDPKGLPRDNLRVLRGGGVGLPS